mgnify:CR=1 FL=1
MAKIAYRPIPVDRLKYSTARLVARKLSNTSTARVSDHNPHVSRSAVLSGRSFPAGRSPTSGFGQSTWRCQRMASSNTRSNLAQTMGAFHRGAQPQAASPSTCSTMAPRRSSDGTKASRADPQRSFLQNSNAYDEG